eukprot:5531399-Alexandrium_andersonii.AAC.1
MGSAFARNAHQRMCSTMRANACAANGVFHALYAVCHTQRVRRHRHRHRHAHAYAHAHMRTL